VQSFFLGKKTEELYLFCLDSEYGVISHSCISRGTVNMVSFSGRTLAEIGLRHKARYLLLAHNHPGGRMQPSADDYRSTEALCQTMQALSMPIVDHIIVCGEKYLSFREKALLPRL